MNKIMNLDKVLLIHVYIGSELNPRALYLYIYMTNVYICISGGGGGSKWKMNVYDRGDALGGY